MTRSLKVQVLFKILELAFLPGQKEKQDGGVSALRRT